MDVDTLFEVVGFYRGTMPVKIVEVVCPIDKGHRLSPLSKEEDTWECLDCGMTFEVKDAIQSGPQ